MKFTTLLAMPALLLAAPLMAQAMPAGDYVKAAGASDLYERTSSQLVMKSTRNPKVRSFAQMMVQHHTKSTADVTAAAKRSRVSVAPPRLMAPQSEMIAQLNSETAEARDAAYVAQQKTAHQQALALHQGYAADGSAPALRQAATKIVPVVQRHIEMLNGM